MKGPLIDARFIRHSGIGRHISGVLGSWTGPSGTVLLPSSEPSVPGWTRIDSRATMYSLAEQGLSLRRLLSASETAWFPHFSHPWKCSGRWTCTIHDVIHLAMPSLFPGLIRRCAAKFLLEDVRDRAASVCFVSAFTRDEFVRLVGMPKGSVHIVGNGVDPSWSLPQQQPDGWDGKPYIVAVGNLKLHKGLGVLLRALDAPHLRDVRLVLIGNASGLRTVDTQALHDMQKLGDRCRWTGPIDDVQLRRWVAHAQALAFPSLYEGFGLPPLEAMMAGVPVVASRIPAVEEACGTAALLVPPGDPGALAEALGEMLRDNTRRQQAILDGKKHAARWNWASVAQATWAAMNR
jgi:glycosyltransferase involved in cell wall biosynthesis